MKFIISSSEKANQICWDFFKEEKSQILRKSKTLGFFHKIQLIFFEKFREIEDYHKPINETLTEISYSWSIKHLQA